MSLSKYPREAVWLVMRWSEIHRKNEQILEWNKSRDESLDRILQSIQDALSNLSKTKSWALFWREIDLKRFHIKKRFFIPYWKKVQGARLEGMTITIDIGPIHLPNAFMQKGVYRGIGLKGANLFGAHLEGADLLGAHLEGATLFSAHLEKAILLGAHLEGINLDVAHLERADLNFTHLEGATLFGTYLEMTNLRDAHLEGAKMCEAILKNATLEDDFLSYAMNKGAVLDDSQKQRVANWEENHPEAPWLKSVYIWDVYLDDENRRNEIRDEEIRTVWEYINRIRSL